MPLGELDRFSVESLYVELLKRSVCDGLHPPDSVLTSAWMPRPGRGSRVTTWLRYATQQLLARRGYELAGRVDIAPAQVAVGRYDPSVPFVGETMIGLKRLDNVQSCVETVIEDAIPGDLIETGVWRGGCTIFMRGILAAHGVRERSVWLADSFEGLPSPDTARYPLDSFSQLHAQNELAVSRDEVEANFRRYGLLDEQVRFVEGWFEQTLPTLRGHTWAVIRLDGDLYQSTIEALENLYPGLSPGGYCIIDDYGTYPACRQAVQDYRGMHAITEPIENIDGSGAFWRRATKQPEPEERCTRAATEPVTRSEPAAAG
jgi:hypothetical protein